MPVPSAIANAAASFKINEGLLDKSVADLTAEEWQTRPNGTQNSMAWIVGHILWARSNTLGLLGSTWSRPWLPLFARGSKPGEHGDLPSRDEIVLAWGETKTSLKAAMEEVSAETLSKPAPEKMPSFDGSVGGFVGFLALHETYHVGQAGYLRRWLGHGQVLG